MILTDEEIIKIEQTPSRSYIVHARAIEQAILDKLQDKLKNADRYEWLRDVGQGAVEVFFVTDKNTSGWGCWDSWRDKDKAIDSTMEKFHVQN